MREEYPSWLYSVKMGATTVWEHWDSLREDGTFWDTSMNSFNHYAYGAVTDWVYSVSAGIRYLEDAPGYQKAIIAPIPTERLDWLKAELDTRNGKIVSYWRKEQDYWRYEITTPVETEIVISGRSYKVQPGTHYFYSNR
jgi:alpha-L-rhamnosidase